MNISANILPRPTSELVQTYISQFNESQTVLETALTNLFQTFPLNTKMEDILLKVVTLNQLYATGILATYRVAEHIFDLQVDNSILAGHTDIVTKIANVEIKGKERYNYSFATKYCAWHNGDSYPIYDRFVEQLLWGYSKLDNFKTYKRSDTWYDYQTFKDVIATFQSYYGLSQFSFKEIDKFLWLAGKEKYAPKNQTTSK